MPIRHNGDGTITTFDDDGKEITYVVYKPTLWEDIILPLIFAIPLTLAVMFFILKFGGVI